MADEMDERYAPMRALMELDKRHSVLDATVTHQLGRISSDLSEIKMLAMRPQAAPADHVNWQSTAMRAMDLMERKQAPGGAHPVLLFLSGLGLLALGGGVAWLFLH